MKTPDSQIEISVLEALEALTFKAKELLYRAAQKETFNNQLREAFGSLFDEQAGISLTERITQNHFDWPAIEILEKGELRGAAGAYAVDSRTIYLATDFLQANILTAPENIIAVLLEEIGHDLDAGLNPERDTPGDEGEIFSALVRDVSLNRPQLDELRSQDDQTSIWLNGAEVGVELATTGATGGNQAINNQQPYGALNYAIALQGTFPSRNLSADPVLGGIAQFAGNFAPRGWAFADGQLLPIDQNQALFSILGTTYGGDGRTTFALPDLRSRIPVGAGDGPGLDSVTLGQKLGTETVRLNEANLPAHSHGIPGQTEPTTATGSGQSFSNVQPSLGLNPVVTLNGVFPSRNLSSDPLIGSIDWFAGNFAPRGTAFAHGQLLPISQYSALFSIIGTTYGGDGRTTFALPDLRGRTPVHYGSGPGLSSIALGQKGGSNTVTLTPQNLPSHSHTLPGQTTSTNTTGENQGFDNRQPFLGVNYQIALTGTFPSRSLEANEGDESDIATPLETAGLIAGDSVLATEEALITINELAQVGIAQWAAAGINDAQIARLESITYEIDDLEPGNLAFVGENDIVTIDADASNRGWFVDTTPSEHSEFGSTDPRTGERLATEAEAISHFDLLTAILHEQGHVLGIAHQPEPGSVMYGSLGIGGRLLPQAKDVAAVDMDEPEDEEVPFLSAGSAAIAGVGMFAGNFPIRGFAQTDGQLLNISQNTALFSLIGTIYGGDGRTTFGLPDLRSRAVVHPGSGPGLSTLRLGQRSGVETTVLSTSTLPNHRHDFTSNTPPTITGTPATTVFEDRAYSFIPSVIDPDTGDTQVFSIQNKPTWASFNTETGELSGMPGNDAVGVTQGIAISVADSGNAIAELASFDLTVINTNDSPTGSLILSSSTATEGLTLTSSSTLSDLDGLGAFTYQWQQSSNGIDWSNIAIAISSSFTPDDAQVDKQLRLEVSYTDGGGTNETVFSNETDTVVNVNDNPTGNVVISTAATEDSELGADTTGLMDADGIGQLSYQWQEGIGGNYADINGATSANFIPGDDQVGQQLRLRIRYTDNGGANETVFSNETNAVANVNDEPTGAVTITGTVAEDSELAASNSILDADGLGSVRYQWQDSSDGNTFTDITGATEPRFTPSDSQIGKQLRVVASYTDGNNTPESVESAVTIAVANVNDPLTGTISITGTVAEDSPLTVSSDLSDADGLGQLTYQWQASNDGVSFFNIANATSATFIPSDAQVGQQLRIVASFVDGNGTTESIESAATPAVANLNDQPTGEISLTGTVAENSQIFADISAIADTDGLGDFSYQWQVQEGGTGDFTNIADATSEIFTPDDAEVGDNLRVVVSYTDGQGTLESLTSAPTPAVVGVNDAPSFETTLPSTLALSRDQASTLDFTVADIDTDLASLTVTATSDNGDLFPEGSLSVTGDGSDRTLSLTPAALGNAAQSATLSLVLSDGDATVTQTLEVTLPTQRAVTDFNSDGTSEVLWRSLNDGSILSWEMQNNGVVGAQTFAAVIPDSPWNMAGTADFDGDGNLDLLGRSTETNAINIWRLDENQALINEVAVSVTPPNALPGQEWQIVGLDDFNGDDQADILWRNQTSGQFLTWYLGGEQGNEFSGGALFDLSLIGLGSDGVFPDLSWQVEATGDFNDDDAADLVWRNQTTGQVVIWQMNEQSELIGGYVLDGVPDTNWQILGSGDYDGNGKSDLFWQHQVSGETAIWSLDKGEIIGGGVLGVVDVNAWKSLV